MSRARTAQCALLYKGWSGIVEWQGERRRREGHEVDESVADIAGDGDCDAERKTAGDCSEQMQISNLKNPKSLQKLKKIKIYKKFKKIKIYKLKLKK